MNNENSIKSLSVVLAITLFLAFAFQGSRGLWEPDEGRYVRSAYEMQKTGNWITPQRNFQPHLTKPPVAYWAIASGLSLFGRNEWGARAFHGLAFALTAMIVGLLGNRIWDRQTGMMACLMYATTVLPFVAGTAVTTDTILTFFITLAVVCFWMSVSGRNRTLQSSVWALLMWFFFGVAFLTKGPAGLLPLLAILIYMSITRDVKRLPVVVTIFGIAIFIVTSLSWFVVIVRQQRGLLAYFLEHEFAGRIFEGEYGRNPGWLGPFKVYLPILTVGVLPWSLFWPRIVLRNRPAVHTLDWWKRLRERPRALFLMLWFSVPLIVFCAIRSRLPLYMLPLIPPLILATARALVVQFPEKTASAIRLRGKPGTAVVVLVLILVSTKMVVSYIPWKRDSRAMWNGIRPVIQKELGNEPYEIILAHENFDGLAFYSDCNVEYTETGKKKQDSSSFVSREHISEEFDELPSSRYRHIFLARNKRIPMILRELDKRAVEYSVFPAPFQHKLVLCSRSRPANDVVRLAVLGDTGTGRSGQRMLGSSLYHIDQGTWLDGIILLGDNVVGWNGKGDPPSAYHEYFEQPYAPLLTNKIPFYAVLGNHEVNHGLTDFQLQYPAFNMEGKRYYSRLFGDDEVEVFFLDSNSIQNDPQQLEWLRQSLERSTAKWKIVAMHHPLWSTEGEYHSDPLRTGFLEPIFLKNGVNLILSGHHHVYEHLQSKSGIDCIIAGSGGKLDRGSLSADSSHRIGGNDEENVFVVLEFDGDECALTAYGRGEKVVDKGTIVRKTPE